MVEKRPKRSVELLWNELNITSLAGEIRCERKPQKHKAPKRVAERREAVFEPLVQVVTLVRVEYQQADEDEARCPA